jgi:phenylacetate-CoA ligase
MIKLLLRGAVNRLPFALNPLQVPYRAFLRRLRKLESLSEEEIRSRQFEWLQGMVRLAYEETDFHRESFDRAGVHPRDLRAPEDLAHFPIISKDDVRAYGDRMLRRGLDRTRLGKVSTSGTTGSPLDLWVDAAAAARERAAIHYQWERVGFRRGAGRIELRGIFEGDGLVKHLPAELVLRVNINRLEPRDLPQIVQTINQHRYPFLHGYPHAIERFARLLEEEGLVATLHHPRAILLGSEAVLEGQWARIRRVFAHSPVIAHYGMAERVALGAWVNESRDYRGSQN